MAQRTEQVEQITQKIWSLRTIGDGRRIAEECDYGEFHFDQTEWGTLPEKVKDCLRDKVEKEVAFMQTLPPPSEVERYLTSLFCELERLRPAKYGATSHGIAWDHDWERLVLLYNLGDVMMPFPLSPGDLGSDPVASAAELHRRASAEARKPDARLIVYKT